MVSETNSNSKGKLRKIVSRALKATTKGVILYVVYFVLMQFIAPVSEFIPDFQQMVEIFVTVYISLVIVTELISGTIFQHFLNTAKAFCIIVYVMFLLRTGIFGLTVGNMSLTVDIRLFLVLAMSMGLLGLAKSVMQAINYVNERAEITSI